MDRKAAKTKSLEGTLSIGDLRRLIDSSSRDGASRVNPVIPLDRALRVYREALAGRDDAEIPKAYVFDVYKQQDRPSRDSRLICNILHDCAPAITEGK